MVEIYSSVQSEVSAQFKKEGSRFIADVFPVVNEEESKSRLESVKKKYFDATHHCYAYVIGAEKHSRYSDDGEPSGTAGIKIHSAIQTKNLSDILVVITRYFGGTKLGVGGLGRAYAESTERVLAGITLMTKAVVNEFNVAFPFAQTNPVMNTINVNKLKISATKYSSEQTTITLQILPSQTEIMKNQFINATSGNALISIGMQKTVVWQ